MCRRNWPTLLKLPCRSPVRHSVVADGRRDVDPRENMPSKSKILSAAAASVMAASLLPGAPLAPASAQGPITVSAASQGPAKWSTSRMKRAKRAVRSMSAAQLRQLAPVVPTGLLSKKVDRVPGYQGQRSCQRGARPGTRALARLLRRTYASGIPIGISRRCAGDTSEHYDGRALDWMVNSRKPRQAAMGDAFTSWLTKRGHGVRGEMARRLGVMYIIWRGRSWASYRPGWSDYRGCSRGGGSRWNATACHFDHVHISLNWPGARKKTSWYRAL